jgi:hypothetical protein
METDLGEVSVIDAGDGKYTIPNFCVREYIGFEIFKYTGIDDSIINKEDCKQIVNKEDLKVGDKVFTGYSDNQFWGQGVIRAFDNGELYIDIGQDKLRGFLEFDKDDRHCWVCGCVANMNGVEKVQFGT